MLSKLPFAGLLVLTWMLSFVVVEMLVVCLPPNALGAPFTLLDPEAVLPCAALLAESSGATSLDTGLSLKLARGVGPRRPKVDVEFTRSWWSAERALVLLDILEAHSLAGNDSYGFQTFCPHIVEF